MIFDDDNQDRPPNSNRFFFSNAPQGRGRILSREGYAVFTSSFTVTWLLCIFFVVWLHLQLTVTNEIVSTISSSAVDLAALSLAVLTILHEFNKEDRWFKLGLFLVGFLFVIDCLTGFYMVVSWNPAYETTQSVDIIVFGVLIIGFVFQSDWELIYTKYSARVPKIFQKSFLLLSKIRPLNLIRTYTPFIIPLAFIWVNRLSPIITFLLIFLGGIIALLCLMMVTSVELVRQRQSSDEQISEDPIITFSRKIAIEQLEASKNLQNLSEDILKSLYIAQEKRISESKKTGDLLSMVADDVIVTHLRHKKVVARQQDIRNCLRLLEKQNRIFSTHTGYWIIPTQHQIIALADNVKKISWFGTYFIPHQAKSQVEWRNFDCSELLSKLAHLCNLPIEVVNEFIFPEAFAVFYDYCFFEKFEFSDSGNFLRNVVFVNLEVKKKITLEDFNILIQDAHNNSIEHWVGNLPSETEHEILSYMKQPIDSYEHDLQKQTGDEVFGQLNKSLEWDNDLRKAISQLDKSSRYKYVYLYLPKRIENFYQKVLTSKYYLECYFGFFSRLYSTKILGILNESIVINNSKLPLDYTRYQSNVKSYQDFLTTLGIISDPFVLYLEKV